MKKLEGSRGVEVFFKWIMFTAAITGMALLSGLYPIKGNIPLILLPSFFVLIFTNPVKFEKMKLMTLMATKILIIFVVLGMFDKQLFVDIVLAMLIVNILEATFTDFFRYKKVFNGISGIALAIGVIVLQGTWQTEALVGQYYLAEGVLPIITLMYIIAYTIWNWIFVTNEFSPSVALMHVGFLLAPILCSIFSFEFGVYGGLGIWLLTRANSLAIGGWLQIGCKSWFEKEFYSPHFEKFVLFTKKQPVQIALMLINVGLIVAALYLTHINGGIQLTFFPMKFLGF